MDVCLEDTLKSEPDNEKDRVDFPSLSLIEHICKEGYKYE